MNWKDGHPGRCEVCMPACARLGLRGTASSEGNTSWTRLRNGNIDDYRKTAQYLVERGYYVIRTGRDMEREIDWGDGIIDYASRFRSDFMDIWLFSNCDLCISTSSGPDVLSLMFSRPTVYVDYCVPLDGEFAHYDALYLPRCFSIHRAKG